MIHNRVDYYQLFKYFFLCFFIIISNCTSINTSNTVTNSYLKNNEIKEVSSKNLNISNSNKFTVKSSSSISHELPLPFRINSVNCSNCLAEAKVDLSVSNGQQISYNGHSNLYITSDGNIYFSVFTLGGWLYGGTNTYIIAKTAPKSSLIGSISAPILTDAHPCREGEGSRYGYDSSSIVSPTRFFRSGNINISISGRDLIVNVSGISSDFDAYWIAPWDGSCRPSQRTDNITSGSVSATFKNVLGFEDTLDVSSSASSIGSDSESLPLKSILTVNPSNPNRSWTLKVSGPLNDDSCSQYSKEYKLSGPTNNITFPDGSPVNQLTNGDYTVEAFFDDDPENKKSLNINVQNKVDLDVSIPEGKGLDSQKIFSAVSGGQADFKVFAPNCPNWQLKITGKKPDIVNPDGTTTSGDSCNWTSNGSGNQDVTWKGTCDDGSIMADGSYTANLSVGSQTKSKTVKLDNTPPEIDNISSNDSNSLMKIQVSFKDSEVNGVSSGIDSNSLILPTSNNPNISISKNGNNVTINVLVDDKDNTSSKTALDIFNEIKNLILQLKINDQVNNVGKITNIIDWSTDSNVIDSSLPFNVLGGDISPHLNTISIGGTIYNNFRCQKVEARALLLNQYKLKNLSYKIVLRRQKSFNTEKLTGIFNSFFYKGPSVASWDLVTNGDNPQIEKITWYGYYGTGTSGTLVDSGLYAFFIEPSGTSNAFFFPATMVGQINVVNTISIIRNYSNSQDTTGDPIKDGADFTPKQKELIKELNRQRNGGVLKSDVWPYEELTDDPANRKPNIPDNYAEVDHIFPKKPQKGSCAPKGSNAFENAQVLPRSLNNPKRNLFHF